jgi:hypothetical protein
MTPLVLTSLDQLLFIMKIKLFAPFFTKQDTLMRRPTVLSLPIQLVFPGLAIDLEAERDTRTS